ncbi:MAG: DUF4337 family protein [Stellaceae bacterium]
MSAHSPALTHSAHDNADHRPADEAGWNFNRSIAIFTAIMATVAAIVGHEASETANKAILLKNEAVLKKAEASTEWNYYQSVSTKLQLVQVAGELGSEPTARQADKAKKYTAQKDEIDARAEGLEKQSADANAKSAALAQPRQRLILASDFVEVAIAVASVTALTRQRWLFAVAVLGGLAGILVAAAAVFLH